MSESSAATKRKRSCLASNEGELRFDSDPDKNVRKTILRAMNRLTINTLSNSDDVEAFHSGQTLLQLFDENSEWYVTIDGPFDSTCVEGLEEEFLSTRNSY